jgi:hypothetical protein
MSGDGQGSSVISNIKDILQLKYSNLNEIKFNEVQNEISKLLKEWELKEINYESALNNYENQNRELLLSNEDVKNKLSDYLENRNNLGKKYLFYELINYFRFNISLSTNYYFIYLFTNLIFCLLNFTHSNSKNQYFLIYL